jgi:hypothetical protein
VVVVLSAWQAVSAYQHLRAARDRVPTVRAQLEDGGTAALREHKAALRDDTGAARRAMQGLRWALFSVLPGLGRNLEAARSVTSTVDDLVGDGLTDLVESPTRCPSSTSGRCAAASTSRSVDELVRPPQQPRGSGAEARGRRLRCKPRGRCRTGNGRSAHLVCVQLIPN